ncbi:T9SS type B sorting domain-containing protein [Salinimicrobium sp. TIG7-5_MAKvit]|uniref:T9SS type B sorting domain-containing protein n=1 Tax=Salinimicrobium sp. TIG7-5_MAKvit TaxID=3121289 RepID=UPI003C6DBC4E
MVRDKSGCGIDSEEVTIIDFPKFFSPNNDGFNDLWQIEGIKNYSNTVVIIFDRYGKILKQIGSNEIGWDGTYNGKPMPSDDYWFSLQLENGEIYKNHFSLIR